MAVAVLLTGVLGYKIYQATQVSSRIVMMTVQADPVAGAELWAQFRANDRIVLYGMAGFGVVLILSIAVAGIWLTHKVAGPLHNIATTCARIRDDHLPPVLRQLRRGDELRSFHAQFAEMYAALRTRAVADIATIDKAIAAIEAQPTRSSELELALAELREQRARKQLASSLIKDELQPPAVESTKGRGKAAEAPGIPELPTRHKMKSSGSAS